MFLASPGFLWALPAAAIPVILYLLFRRKRRNVSWGSMYILRLVLETKSRQMLWIQYLIVALRTLALLALVLAFVRPHRPWRPPAEGAFPRAPASTHRLALVDTSTSMQTRFENARSLDAVMSLCRKMIEAGREPGRLELMPMNGKAPSFTIDDLPVPAAQQEQILAECAAAVGRADLEKGLRAALSTFRASPFGRRELFIVSDFALRDFSGRTALAPLFEALRRQDVRVYGLRYHPADAKNFAVLDLTPEGDVLLAQQPTWFYLTLGYYGDADTAETTVTIETAKGDVLLERTVSLANGEKTLRIPLALPAGEATLTARVGDDDLAWDNRLRRSFSVRDRLHVMVVQNIVMKQGFDNPRTWLNLALSNPDRDRPSAGGDYRNIQSGAEAVAAANQAAAEKALLGAATDRPFEIQLDGKIPEQLNPDLLAHAEFVMLVDIAGMPAESIEALHRYVVRGGTVMLAPGPDADPVRFNAAFQPLSPLLLEAPRVAAIDPDHYEQCYAEAGEEPLLRELEAGDGANIGNPRFYNCYRVKPDSLAAESRVLLSLTDGSPLLAERRVGRGAVLLWTAGVGGEWHSMGVHPAYPVFLIRLMNQALSRQAFKRNQVVGEPILSPTDGARVKIVRPDGRHELVDAVRAGTRDMVRYDRTDVPGDYEVRTDIEGDSPGQLYHVRGDSHESDLRTLEGDARKQYEQMADSRVADSEAELAAVLGADYRGASLAFPAAILALLCLLGEAGLSRRYFV